jgi:hypothetical protein
MMICRSLLVTSVLFSSILVSAADDPANKGVHKHDPHKHLQFAIHSVASGNWSEAKTWQPPRVPRNGDRVLISRGTRVVYDAKKADVIRLVQVMGILSFARDCDTELNVGILKVQNSDKCREDGFACDFLHLNKAGLPTGQEQNALPTLEIGTAENPIPAQFTARVRLHYLDGMNRDDAPAIACCSARMEIHGSPLSRSWVKLGANVKTGDQQVTLSEAVQGWRVGDAVIVTASKRDYTSGSFRDGDTQTERRTITAINGKNLTLDKPLAYVHFGTGSFRSEVANLSRNVIIESADPNGVRGHTVYHRFSKGGISYARLAHLGKENVLGRYAIHFHLVGRTMRGSSVVGAAIVDSHNRWVTIHGTQYMIVRDCVGYRSIGHGFFLEDGTEVYNLLHRNLGVNAFDGKRLPRQALPFDPNDGAAFWWANGRNTLTDNVACENDRYGFRYDSQKRSNFDSNLPVLMPDGKEKTVDIRSLAISRFSNNESHSEGLYSVAVSGTDGVGPDTHDPHRINGLKIWQTHYALRAGLPTMLIENVTIDHANYGIYRPWFENHVYRNMVIASTNTEPFNRGLDDRSLQHGSLTVDGLTFSGIRGGGNMPLIQISANNVSGKAESHFRNVKVVSSAKGSRKPLLNLGGGPRLTPKTPKGVPVFVHNYFGPGRHAKVVSARAKDLLGDGSRYRKEPPLTGDESLVAEVKDVEFPELLKVVDDLPPATVITSVRRLGGKAVVSGTTHDDGEIVSVQVNGQNATLVPVTAGVVDWRTEITVKPGAVITAMAHDKAGNKEQTPHRVILSK